MPFELFSEFDRNRLEKGRKLLQESEEHRGSRDLQLYVEGLDFTAQLHRIFLDDSGQRRQGLTAQEKLQGVVVFLHLSLRDLAELISDRVVTDECYEAIVDANTEIQGSTLPWRGMMGIMLSAATNCVQAFEMPTGDLVRIMDNVSKMTSHPAFSAAAAELELHQRSSGFDPVLSAADMRLLLLYSQQEAAGELLKRQPEAAQKWLAAGLSANRQLLQLDPSAAAQLHCQRAGLLNVCNRHSEGMAAYRSALREASEHKSPVVEAKATQQLALALVNGCAGPRWSVEEVRGLLKTAKTALAKCKQWMPPEIFASFKSRVAEATAIMNAEVARHPGAAMLPALGAPTVFVGSHFACTCSGCGRIASSMKKCSSCQVAAYCSRACQVRHWKQGGHKQECSRMAAGGSGSGGAGGSSRS